MTPGQTLSHYKVLSLLGKGSMGRVWLAEDLQLGRKVALKLLAPEMAGDPQHLRRFTVEAKAVAALNHPNIAQIYEFGEEKGVHFLAMECVEGHTLAERLSEGPLSEREILELGIQVTEALGEAHAKGIVHRDLKPGNIMVNDRGQAKVLDFGLALTERQDYSSTAETLAPSESGVVGTPRYMSPEQCLGRDVDPRSDLFSLGAVLYEMATGKPAFPGSTWAAVYDGILNKAPAPVVDLNPRISADLRRVILRALEKDRDLRYQTASDLRADLRRLERDSHTGLPAAPEPVTPRSRRSLLQWGAAATVAAAAGAGGWFALRGGKAGGAGSGPRMAPLTSLPGSEYHPTFSPDGTQVAFSWSSETETNWDLYVRVVDAGVPLKITNNPGMELSPSWSPDGKYLAFLRVVENGPGSGFFIIPALGGRERQLSTANPDRTGVDAPFISWSPDGKMAAIADKERHDEPMSIWLLNIETGERRRLTNPPRRIFGDSAPQFSPDASRLLFVRTTGITVQDIYILPVTGGEPRKLTNENRRIFGAAWNYRDGKIWFTSNRGSTQRLWKISPDGGDPERVPGLGEGAGFLTLSRAGDRMAYTRTTIDTNVWLYDITGKQASKRLISSTRFEQGPRWSPDGKRIAFASSRSGSSEIWVCDSQGQNASQITNFRGLPTGSPRWSPDGKWIAFDSRPGGNPDVYVVSAEGGKPRRLTTEPGDENVPSWSRDGKWVYFCSNRTGQRQIWKAPAEGGGEAVQVTKGGGFHGVESSDGQYFYYAKSPTEPGLWRIGMQGGAEEAVLPDLTGGYWGYWDMDDRGIYFLEREDINENNVRYHLAFQDFRTRQRRRLMQFDNRPFNSGLSVSPDAHWVLYTQVDSSNTDIMLVENLP